MTTLQSMPTDAVLVAIDVSRHRHETLIEVPGRTRRRRLTVLNTQPEHDRQRQRRAPVRVVPYEGRKELAQRGQAWSAATASISTTASARLRAVASAASASAILRGGRLANDDRRASMTNQGVYCMVGALRLCVERQSWPITAEPKHHQHDFQIAHSGI